MDNEMKNENKTRESVAVTWKKEAKTLLAQGLAFVKTINVAKIKSWVSQAVAWVKSLNRKQSIIAAVAVAAVVGIIIACVTGGNGGTRDEKVHYKPKAILADYACTPEEYADILREKHPEIKEFKKTESTSFDNQYTDTGDDWEYTKSLLYDSDSVDLDMYEGGSRSSGRLYSVSASYVFNPEEASRLSYLQVVDTTQNDVDMRVKLEDALAWFKDYPNALTVDELLKRWDKAEIEPVSEYKYLDITVNGINYWIVQKPGSDKIRIAPYGHASLEDFARTPEEYANEIKRIHGSTINFYKPAEEKENGVVYTDTGSPSQYSGVWMYTDKSAMYSKKSSSGQYLVYTNGVFEGASKAGSSACITVSDQVGTDLMTKLEVATAWFGGYSKMLSASDLYSVWQREKAQQEAEMDPNNKKSVNMDITFNGIRYQITAVAFSTNGEQIRITPYA
mgnify:CR=1 FL=1